MFIGEMSFSLKNFPEKIGFLIPPCYICFFSLLVVNIPTKLENNFFNC